MIRALAARMVSVIVAGIQKNAQRSVVRPYGIVGDAIRTASPSGRNDDFLPAVSSLPPAPHSAGNVLRVAYLLPLIVCATNSVGTIAWRDKSLHKLAPIRYQDGRKPLHFQVWLYRVGGSQRQLNCSTFSI